MVKLVHITPEAEALILRIARVSSDDSNTDPGLLGYLIRHGHWSPFEMVSMCMEIRTSRAITAQILRHRSFSFQEFSQRYATVGNKALMTEARVKGSSNRQGSVETDDLSLQEWWNEAQVRIMNHSSILYHEALNKGIAPEVARMILPLATETRLYMHGTVRSWIHYLGARCDEHAQKEHRVLALEAREIFVDQLPIVASALGWAENRSEGAVSG